MIIKTHEDYKSCDVVIANFIFGPQTCDEPTKFTTHQDGEDYRICRHHIESNRSSNK